MSEAGDKIIQLVRESTPQRAWWNVWGPALLSIGVTVVGATLAVAVITGQYLGRLDALTTQVGHTEERVGSVEDIARGTKAEVGLLNLKMDNFRSKLEEERQDRLNDERRRRIDSPPSWRTPLQPTIPAR